MASVIDVKKERVWTALLDGFEKYLAVLTERAALIQETDALKQQVSKRWYSYTRFGRDILCNVLCNIVPNRVVKKILSSETVILSMGY